MTAKSDVLKLTTALSRKEQEKNMIQELDLLQGIAIIFCTYGIVSYRRGWERSLDSKDILNKVTSLIESGGVPAQKTRNRRFYADKINDYARTTLMGEVDGKIEAPTK